MSYIVEAGPFNGPDDIDSAMNWVDITNYVNDRRQPLTINTGRQTELDQVDIGRLSLVLNNPDDRFTAGNTTSPYYPGWSTSMRIRVREQIGNRTFVDFDGNMLQPDLLIQTAGVDQTVTVNAVDRIGRLGQGRKFVSTLTEYIRYTGGTALKALWPLNDPAGSLVARQVSRSGLGGLTIEGQFAGDAPTSVGNLLAFGGTSPPPGDDLNVVQFNPVLDSTLAAGFAAENRLVNRSIGPISLLPATTPYLTLACWQRLDPTNTFPYQVVQLNDPVLFNIIQFKFAGGVGNNIWQVIVATNNGILTVDGAPARAGNWDFLACRLNNTTGAIDFWVNNNSFTASLPGATTGTLDQIAIDAGSPGHGAGYAQIYTGASTVFDRAAFDAQYAMGYTGLAGQSVGDRITTLARYAGMSTADLAIDQGTAALQNAALAGKTPLGAMQEAADTDQGLLHAAGRKLIYHARKRRYDL